jgi:hypothetical protein
MKKRRKPIIAYIKIVPTSRKMGGRKLAVDTYRI